MANEKENPVNGKTGADVSAEPIMRKYADIIKEMELNGSIRRNNLVVTRARYGISVKENPILTIAIDGFVKAMRPNMNNNGEYEPTYTRYFTILFDSIITALSHIPDYAWLCEELRNNPRLAQAMLPGAVISILQTEVFPENKYYTNPFNGNEKPIDNHTFYNDIVDIKLSTVGLEFAKELRHKLIYGND